MENPMKYNYDTLSEAVNDIQKRGYTVDVLAEIENGKYIESDDYELSPDEFIIDEFYRFEGMSNPSDNSIVYAISSKKHNLKGIIINAYGADYGSRAQKLVEHLNTRHQE